jgi:hypothetical protein
MRSTNFTLLVLTWTAAGCGVDPPTPSEVAEACNAEVESLDGLRKERKCFIDKCEYGLRDVENAYSRAKGIPIQQVKDKPSEKTVRELNEWRNGPRGRLSRRLEEIDAETVKQAERVDRLREWKVRIESAQR